MSTDWNALTAAAAAKPTFTIPENIAAQMTKRGFPLDKDGVLLFWQKSQAELSDAKNLEMELRKLSVAAFVPGETKKEGMNNVDLGNGYTLKAGIKYNYNLVSRKDGRDVVDEVDDVIDDFAKISSNEGTFIANRLFKWTAPTLSITEYRQLVEAAKTDEVAARLLKRLGDVLEISDAAPTLEIKEPKVKK